MYGERCGCFPLTRSVSGPEEHSFHSGSTTTCHTAHSLFALLPPPPMNHSPTDNGCAFRDLSYTHLHRKHSHTQHTQLDVQRTLLCASIHTHTHIHAFTGGIFSTPPAGGGVKTLPSRCTSCILEQMLLCTPRHRRLFLQAQCALFA